MKRFTIENPQTEIRQYKGRVVVIGILITFLLIGLIIRLVYLQAFQHRYYLALSKQNLLTISPIDPSRGLIYDRNGVLLAGNMPVFSLEIVPDKVANLKQTLNDLSHIIHFSDSDRQNFEKQISQTNKFNFIPLKVKLSDQEMAAFAVNQYQFPGVSIRAHMVRYYPYGPLMEPVLGYVGRINAEELAKVDSDNYSASNYIGKSGVEKYDETLLHGRVGIFQMETSATGEVVWTSESRPAVAGQTLYLTIDTKFQLAIQNALEEKAGAIVAIDPRNGEVLALVSNPSFDPNQFVTGISIQAYQALQNNPERPLFNRVLQGEYPPGSTIKPFYAIESLENHIIDPMDSIYDPGFFKLPNSDHVYHDWNKVGHSKVNIEKAITQSCDVFFFHLAEKMGIERMGNILHQFGWGFPTGIDTYIERNGLVPSPEWKQHAHHESWYPGDTINAGIGQGYVLVTPLQLATALMRLIDRGDEYQPHLLLKTELPNGTISYFQRKAYPPLHLSDKNLGLVLQAMREVVTDPHGTCYQAGHTASYTFGGKSGTAQVFSLKGNRKDKANMLPKKLRDHSWFISFTPADHPKIVMAVFLEHGGEGQAGFMTRKILDNYLNKKSLQNA